MLPAIHERHIQILEFLIFLISITATPDCDSRTFIEGIVCVCNATHCDDIEPLGKIPHGFAAIYRSTVQGARMDRVTVKHRTNYEGVVVELDPSTVYQEILGFGGAFTDSTGINIRSLPKEAQDTLIRQYFGPTGTEYTIGRVPIASTDFSYSQYSYDDFEGDFDLTNFALRHEDFEYKIPFIKQATELQKKNGGMRLFASPWSAPAWMKTNGQMKGGGELRGDKNGPYYVTWSNYFVKFFEAYLNQGISFWAVTPQNEPTTGAQPDYAWQTMLFDAQGESDFVKNQLGPSLRSSNASKDVIILGLDDNRNTLPAWADVMFSDSVVSSFVAGIGIHWYEDINVSASVLTTTHERHPDKFILATEACNGWLERQGKGVRLGLFYRAELYARSIITDLNNWVAGWTDWNMALDTEEQRCSIDKMKDSLQGGFTWALNYVDAPIIVNGDEFYKQPMYYALAHFSKFLKPGAKRVHVQVPDLPRDIFVLGAVMVHGERYITVLNMNDSDEITISIREKGIDRSYIKVYLPAHSIVTVIWNKL